jgi:lipoate-protein ligase A
MVFERLRLWLDPVARPGPEAMAVDEWLLEQAAAPVMRVYRWAGAWATTGCFGDLDAARAAIPGVSWVRRWTGGGVVDHRADWTYTLAVPAGERLAALRGAESYVLIHRAVVEALRAEGIAARLTGGAAATGSALCFANPVAHDVVDAAGGKLAGAGQRRTRAGLLHQGSVAVPLADAAASRRRAEFLAAALADSWKVVELAPPAEMLAAKAAARYANPEWTHGRRTAGERTLPACPAPRPAGHERS